MDNERKGVTSVTLGVLIERGLIPSCIVIIVTKYCFFKPLRRLQHPIFIFAGIEIEYIERSYHRTFSVQLFWIWKLG